MNSTLMSNRKRIERLEKELGISKDFDDIDHWEEIKACACECMVRDIPEDEYVLPDYLKFAEHIFYRVLKIFKKLRNRIMELRLKKDANSEKFYVYGHGNISFLESLELKWYKILYELDSIPAARFLRKKLFSDCENVGEYTRNYIHRTECQNEPYRIDPETLALISSLQK